MKVVEQNCIRNCGRGITETAHALPCFRCCASSMVARHYLLDSPARRVCATIELCRHAICSGVGTVTLRSAAPGSASRSARLCRSLALAATRCRTGSITAARVDQPSCTVADRSLMQRHCPPPRPMPLVQRTGEHPDTRSHADQPAIAAGRISVKHHEVRRDPRRSWRTCSTMREPLRAERLGSAMVPAVTQRAASAAATASRNGVVGRPINRLSVWRSSNRAPPREAAEHCASTCAKPAGRPICTSAAA